MPKWLLFGLAAVADFVLAFLFFYRGRLIVPAILAIASVCFFVAAVKAAKGTRDQV